MHPAALPLYCMYVLPKGKRRVVRKGEGDGRTDGPSNCRKKGGEEGLVVVAAGVVHGDGTEVGMCELRNIFSRQADDDDGKRGCKKGI